MATPMNNPLVSVIMPVYNAQEYLREAIDNILSQTYSEFECIIVNDGSTDASAEIIRSFRDPRIIVMNNEKNLGLVATMTGGLARARGAYIIRADADDGSLPKRIETQVRYMETHPDIGIVSSWMRTIGTPNGYLMKSFTEPEEICANLLFNTTIAQPAACIRASLFKEGLAYDPAFKDGAEDYDLWTRASEVTRIACLPNALVQYRIHATNVSTVRAEANRANTRAIRLRQLARLGLIPTEEELMLHSSISCPHDDLPLFLADQERWFKKIITANDACRRYDQTILMRILRYRWFLLLDANARAGITVLHLARHSVFAFTMRDVGMLSYLKFTLKAILRT